GMPFDQCPERRLSCAVIATDLMCESERVVPRPLIRLLLRGGERRLRVPALNHDVRQGGIIARPSGLQLDGLSGCLLGLVEAIERSEIKRAPKVNVSLQRVAGQRLPREVDRL